MQKLIINAPGTYGAIAARQIIQSDQTSKDIFIIGDDIIRSGHLFGFGFLNEGKSAAKVLSEELSTKTSSRIFYKEKELTMSDLNLKPGEYTSYGYSDIILLDMDITNSYKKEDLYEKSCKHKIGYLSLINEEEGVSLFYKSAQEWRSSSTLKEINAFTPLHIDQILTGYDKHEETKLMVYLVNMVLNKKINRGYLDGFIRSTEVIKFLFDPTNSE